MKNLSLASALCVGFMVGLFSSSVSWGQGQGSIGGTNSGDVTLNTIGAASNANGASIAVPQVLRLQPASASFGGVVTTGAQTLAGAKTLTSTLTCNQDD